MCWVTESYHTVHCKCTFITFLTWMCYPNDHCASAAARHDGSLKRNSLPQIFLHRLVLGCMDWLCDQTIARLQAVILMRVLLGHVSLCPLHDFCFLEGCSPPVMVHQRRTKPGNQNWQKHAQQTGCGKIAFTSLWKDFRLMTATLAVMAFHLLTWQRHFRCQSGSGWG